MNSRPPRTYDHIRLNRASKKTIGQIKLDRLAIKNERRAANGLAEKKTYAEI